MGYIKCTEIFMKYFTVTELRDTENRHGHETSRAENQREAVREEESQAEAGREKESLSKYKIEKAFRNLGEDRDQEDMRVPRTILRRLTVPWETATLDRKVL